MKILVTLIALLVLSSFQIFAQNLLIGTWENTNNSVKSIKIITPTHFMIFAKSLNEDKADFVRSHGGSYTLIGNKFVEKIEIASWEDYGQEKTNFVIKIDRNTFYKKGTVTLKDSTVILIDEVWNRVFNNYSYKNNPSIGVWDQLNSSYTLPDGTKESHTNATATRFQIITPTHWMRISHRDGKFENFMGGSYKFDGKKMYPNFEYSSFSDDEYREVVIKQKVKGNKKYWKGYAITMRDNETYTFEDEFQQVNPKVSKAIVEK